jgi:competence protein ComEA
LGALPIPIETRVLLETPGPALPLNINQASQADLEALPGIGPAIAARIVAYRQVNGPFENIEEIQSVKGIGPSIFAEIRDRITVGAP